MVSTEPWPMRELQQQLVDISDAHSTSLCRLENRIQSLQAQIDSEFSALHNLLGAERPTDDGSFGGVENHLHSQKGAGQSSSLQDVGEGRRRAFSLDKNKLSLKHKNASQCRKHSLGPYDDGHRAASHKPHNQSDFVARTSIQKIDSNKTCLHEQTGYTPELPTVVLNTSSEDISCLLGTQSSVFARSSEKVAISTEFSFRENIRQALQSSRRSHAGINKKSKRRKAKPKASNTLLISPARRDANSVELVGSFIQQLCSNSINTSQRDSETRELKYKETQSGKLPILQTENDILAFAALDFKLSLHDANKSTMVASKRHLMTQPQPVAEGTEPVPNILTASLPVDCPPLIGVPEDRPLQIKNINPCPTGSEYHYQHEVPFSDSSGSITESEEGYAQWVSIIWLQWIWAIFFSILHPTGFFRTKWDFYMLLLFAYVCIVAPYIICFGVELPKNSPLGVIEFIVDVSFVLDIYLNFRTASFDDANKLIATHKDIALLYIRTWLPVDLVSVIPFDRLVVNEQLGFVKLFKATRVVKLVKILRLLKIVKMLRLFKIPTLLRHLESAFGRGLLRLVSFMSAAILVTHLVACFFYYSAYLEGYHKDTWVTIGQLQNASNFDKYVTALYWSMSTLTTVGYGDVTPGNANEKIMSMVGMVVGVTVFAYFMGSMSAMMSSINSSNTRITRKLMAVEDFLRQRKVPINLAERIRTFFNYILSRQIIVEETSLINELSLPLRTEIVLFLYREALERLPFFQGKDPQFIVHIVTSLKLEYYAPGEIVIRQGDPGNMMYFVGNGILEVRLYYEGNHDSESTSNKAGSLKASEVPPTNSSSQQVNEKHSNTLDLVNAWRNVSMFGPSESYQKLGNLQAGEYFGEYSCLLGECRTATVVAHEYCELYSLSRADLDEILEDLPELGKVFLKMVEGYVEAGFAKNLVNQRLQNRMDSPDPCAPQNLDESAQPRSMPRKSILQKIISGNDAMPQDFAKEDQVPAGRSQLPMNEETSFRAI